MSVYLGYNEVTKQYLRGLAGGSSSGGSTDSGLSASGFTMTGDIDMGGNEVIGLDDPSSDSSATSKKYVDDEIAKVSTGGLDQATADGRYLRLRTRLRQMRLTLFFPKRTRPTRMLPLTRRTRSPSLILSTS